ncbi:MAG: hypothetical protein QUV05_20935 [Phycisphaerae bacterium]|nr:hypothetical protein [Phycisphaerae bacterium]
MKPIKRLLAKLPSARPDGDGWLAVCPICGGVLRISEGWPLILLTCGNGCRMLAILDKLRLRCRDIKTKSATAKPSATSAAETEGCHE